jgi:hypothetical protein
MGENHGPRANDNAGPDDSQRANVSLWVDLRRWMDDRTRVNTRLGIDPVPQTCSQRGECGTGPWKNDDGAESIAFDLDALAHGDHLGA